MKKKETSRNKNIICLIFLSICLQIRNTKYIVYVHRTHSFETRNQITPKLCPICIKMIGNIVTAGKRSLQRLCFYTCLSFCPQGVGGGIQAYTTGHTTNHYIGRCTGEQSQLMTGQHTGNIKCIMGQVT